MTPVGRSHFLPDSGSAFPCRSSTPDRLSAMDHPQVPVAPSSSSWSCNDDVVSEDHDADTPD